MRVVHVNTYENTGGAARAAHRLHKGLQRLGSRSSMFVAYGDTGDKATIALQLPKNGKMRRIRRRVRAFNINRALSRYASSRPSGYDIFSDDRSPYAREVVNQLPPCDVINLHWVAGLVDYGQFFAAVPAATPVVWTLHDMNPLTGGCHYNGTCERYASVCGACPQLGSSDPSDLAYRIWLRKRRAFAQAARSRLHIVTPSRWLATEVHRSGLALPFPVSVIPYGLDLDDFAPRNRRTAREVFGLPQHAKVILFIADGLGLRRKGFVYLAEALKGLSRMDDLVVLCLGRGTLPDTLNIPCVNAGVVHSDRLLSFAYSAADLLVVPSLQDNLPNTVLEAMACGLPVVGFDVGGIPEMVRNGVTGILTPAGDVARLREAVLELLQSGPRREAMAAASRRVATDEYSLEIQARRYSELYERLFSAAVQA
jgi:glycosyltransferase involved in cell wall biosynthesis